ncbi:MAG: thioredoxin [Gammaproteobacteria bacterium]|nr:thioredoxin [Gammaproteobacteria bacterium]MBT7308464.1 thioredoxin [Gammaproteobacteria bacterium]
MHWRRPSDLEPVHSPSIEDYQFQVDVENFQRAVIDESSRRLVVLDISAEWCAPCRVLEPILDRLSEAYKGAFLLAKLEAEDENMKIAGRFSARGFPTVIAFVDGEEVDRFQSAQSETFVRLFIDQHLGK